MTRDESSLHPEDAAWLQRLVASSKLTPAEEERFNRLSQLATVSSRRAGEALRGLLPDILVDIFASDISTALVVHPLVSAAFTAASADWAHPHLTPEEEYDGHLAEQWPREPPLRTMYEGAHRSTSDYLFAGPQEHPHTLAWVSQVVFGFLAAAITGALVGADQLRGADQQRARLMTAKARDLFTRYRASLPPAEQEGIERISLRLDELPRHETMAVLEVEDGLAHFHAMVALGQVLAQRIPQPFPVPAPR